MIPKNKPFRSKLYLDYIRSLPCCVTGITENIIAHHVTGLKNSGMGTKPSDECCIPLTAFQHQLLHQDPIKWQETYGTQQSHLDRTLFKAYHDGVLDSFAVWKTGL